MAFRRARATAQRSSPAWISPYWFTPQRLRQVAPRIAREERLEALPREPVRTRSACEPFPPQPCDLGPVTIELPHVPRDAVIGIVTLKPQRQSGVLPAHELVPIGSAPIVDCCQRTGKTALGRPLPYHLLPSP